jgi:hypothetical protein
MFLTVDAEPTVLSVEASPAVPVCDSCHVSPPLEGYDTPLCSECLSAHFRAEPGYTDRRREYAPICDVKTKQGRVRPQALDEEHDYEGGR